MKAVVALVFLGLVALSYAGFAAYSVGVPTLAHPYHPYAAVPALAHTYAAVPYSYNTVANYKLTLDTSLPGSAYASYPYAAAPTAYGYGVIKA